MYNPGGGYDADDDTEPRGGPKKNAGTGGTGCSCDDDDDDTDIESSINMGSDALILSLYLLFCSVHLCQVLNKHSPLSFQNTFACLTT